MGEVDALGPALGDREIGHGHVEITGRRGGDQLSDGRQHLVFGLQVEFGGDGLPELDRHAAETAVLLDHEGRADVEPDPERL
jgi:hypothetical protein